VPEFNSTKDKKGCLNKIAGRIYFRDRYPTKTETDIVYNLGLGIRFDLNRQFSLQPSYNKAWTDMGSRGIPDFDVWRLDFIFRM